MSISHDQWNRWLVMLEDILHEADMHGAHLLGIHVDSAIEVIHAKFGTTRQPPYSDSFSIEE